MDRCLLLSWRYSYSINSGIDDERACVLLKIARTTREEVKLGKRDSSFDARTTGGILRSVFFKLFLKRGE